MSAAIPSYDVDLYSDEVLAAPYPHYRALRDGGPVVWLPRNGLYAIARYKDVRESLRAHQLFSSAEGVAANDAANQGSKGTTIASDPPDHTAMRQVIGAPMLPSQLALIRSRIEEMAGALVERLVAQREFDAVTDLAQHIPVNIVSKLVGLPEQGRQNMLKWAAATFDMLGAANDRCAAAQDSIREMRSYVINEATRDKIRPGSWISKIYEASDRGLFPESRCPVLMRDYLGPALDTTIFAMANIIWLFGRFPEQWDLVRADPGLIPNALNEAVRLESPIRGFTRQLTADRDIEDVRIPAGARVALFYASANRDERKWEAPEAFNVRRKVNDHVGYGHGVHTCAGMHLARLEIHSVLAALVTRVERFEIGAAVPAINNLLRGFSSVRVRVH
ncbi:MAG TPA: cytochrome P450 [Tardiphaga sp.]